MWFLVLGVLLIAACTYTPEYPKEGVSNFYTDDPILEHAAMEAVKQWTDAGVVGMASVLINIDRDGVPIRWAKAEDMPRLCNSKDPEGKGRLPNGCTSYSADDGHVDAIYIDQDADYDTIVGILMHEFVHVVLNIRKHNPQDGGVFSVAGKKIITQGDLNWICKQTQCIDPHLPAPILKGKKKG